MTMITPRKRGVLNGKKRGHDLIQFPASVVADVLRPYIERDGMEAFAIRARLPPRSVFAIMSGERTTVGLAVVDDLLTHGVGDSGLFHQVPELAAIYER